MWSLDWISNNYRLAMVTCVSFKSNNSILNRVLMKGIGFIKLKSPKLIVFPVIPPHPHKKSYIVHVIYVRLHFQNSLSSFSFSKECLVLLTTNLLTNYAMPFFNFVYFFNINTVFCVYGYVKYTCNSLFTIN